MKANHMGRLASGLWSRVRLFRDQDYSLTALLMMLAVTLFVVTPLASSAIIGSQIVMCSVSVLTVIGVTVVTGRRSASIKDRLWCWTIWCVWRSF